MQETQVGSLGQENLKASQAALVVKNPALQCRRPKRCLFSPWVTSPGGGHGKIPWRRAWQPIPAFLPGESHGQRSLVNRAAKSQKQLKRLSTHMHTHTHASYGSSRSRDCPSWLPVVHQRVTQAISLHRSNYLHYIQCIHIGLGGIRQEIVSPFLKPLLLNHRLNLIHVFPQTFSRFLSHWPLV